MILVCGGSKGGSGKTTVSTNLAVLRASEGRDVLMVDADEQESSTIFSAIRRKEHADKPQYTSVVLRDDRVRTEVTALCGKFDDVIIDTGGRDSRSQRSAIAVADLLLVPFNPRSLDIWTIENNEKIVHDLLPFNPNLRIVAFLNRADPYGSDNDACKAILSDLEWLEFADTPLGNRKAFGKAVASGLAVTELKPQDPKASDEASAFYTYIFGME